jgi:hypothetical protein
MIIFGQVIIFGELERQSGFSRPKMIIQSATPPLHTSCTPLAPAPKPLGPLY